MIKVVTISLKKCLLKCLLFRFVLRSLRSPFFWMSDSTVFLTRQCSSSWFSSSGRESNWPLNSSKLQIKSSAALLSCSFSLCGPLPSSLFSGLSGLLFCWAWALQVSGGRVLNLDHVQRMCCSSWSLHWNQTFPAMRISDDNSDSTLYLSFGWGNRRPCFSLSKSCFCMKERKISKNTKSCEAK